MRDIPVMKVLDASEDLVKKKLGLMLFDTVLIDNEIKELSAHDSSEENVDKVLCLNDVDDVYNIWMRQALEYGNFLINLGQINSALFNALESDVLFINHFAGKTVSKQDVDCENNASKGPLTQLVIFKDIETIFHNLIAVSVSFPQERWRVTDGSRSRSNSEFSDTL